MNAAPAMIADDDLEQLLAVFRNESADNLASLEQALLELESLGAVDAELLGSMLRAAHTLKGNSSIVGNDAVTAAAHGLEDELERLREGTLPFSTSVVTGLLDSVDALRDLLAGAPGADAADTAPAVAATTARTTLRVQTRRLDTLLDLTGEITISRGRLSQLLQSTHGGDATLATTLWQLEQLHAALQGEVMALRMVPLGPVFEAQRRAIRDTASKLDKQARLVILGHDVEVDTSIAEQMRDPLTHMIRNALDHGIESAEARMAAGKPAAGTLTLRASHQAGIVVIELEDDGRGLDRARIGARAQAMGLVADPAPLDDARLFDLIFEPAFSTAAEVTDVSGRGVGMDVVRRHVQALRGTIEIDSVKGRGTRFIIRLPLTVAIISGFTVGVGAERFVLPLDTVEEVVDCGARTGDEGMLELRGQPLPWLRLGALLGVRAAADARSSAVVVRHGDQRVALVVDVLDGDCQAVIKPLSAGLSHLPGVGGSTILGDGRVAFILNVPELVSIATDRASRLTNNA